MAAPPSPTTKETMNATPAIIYAAKSTADVRGSIPTQIEDGRKLAEAEGLEVVAEYADEAASAFSGDRGPELAKARDQAEALAAEHGECVFIIQHSDRLARGDGIQAAHLVEYALWAIKTSVKIRSVQDPQTFADLLYAVVTGQRNHEDSRRKSLAVKAGMERRAARGLATGGPRPYGYRYADDGSGLAIVRSESEVVRRIFAEFVAGSTLSAIARGLHGDGVGTLRGGLWRQSTVRGILANPIYAGRVRYDGEIHDGEHEAIVEHETWQRAATLLAAHSHGARGRPPKGRHLFRGGMLRCECGEAMVPRTNGRYELYYCNGRSKLGRDFCDMPYIRRAVIDTAVYNYFESLGLDLEATREQVAEAQGRKVAEARALREDAEREARRAEERRARVRRDYSDGKLPAEDWVSFRDELTEEMEGARAEADRHRAAQAQAEADPLSDVETDVLARLADIRRAVAGEIQDADGIDAVRAALARLFERFVLHPQENPRYGRTRREDPPPEGPRTAPLLDVDQFTIEVWVRERMLDGYDERLNPVLRREPLGQAGNKGDKGSPWR